MLRRPFWPLGNRNIGVWRGKRGVHRWGSWCDICVGPQIICTCSPPDVCVSTAWSSPSCKSLTWPISHHTSFKRSKIVAIVPRMARRWFKPIECSENQSFLIRFKERTSSYPSHKKNWAEYFLVLLRAKLHEGSFSYHACVLLVSNFTVQILPWEQDVQGYTNYGTLRYVSIPHTSVTSYSIGKSPSKSIV
jgi:hypothetical protein